MVPDRDQPERAENLQQVFLQFSTFAIICSALKYLSVSEDIRNKTDRWANGSLFDTQVGHRSIFETN